MLHALIADDEPVVRQSIALMLKAQGHTYEAAGSPREAERLAEAARAEGRPYDMLVVDYHFVGEDLDGIELVEALFGLLGRLPTVMLTASTDPDVRKDALAAGVTVFVNKPVQAERFGAAVREALARASAPRA
ncbi:MAG: response regulator [Candidatus Sericytochromatia bacterium]|nr:response regulator [Candidatus Sericytochromatia bacterium]